MQWVGYQQRYLADLSPFKAMCKARQIGVSEVVAFERAMRALGLQVIPGQPPKETRPVSQNLVSAAFPQAKDLLRRVLIHIQAIATVAYGPKAKVIKSQSATLAELFNGARLRAYSTSPRGMRGFNGDVLLDEFASVPRPDEVWAAIAPQAGANLGSRDGNMLVVVSTPLGDANRFHEIIRGKYRDGFSQHQVTIHDAILDGFPLPLKGNGQRYATVAEFKDSMGDPEMFAQEYECDFAAASGLFISQEIYDAALASVEDRPEGFGDAALFYGGMDVARVKDRTAFSKLGRMGDEMWHACAVHGSAACDCSDFTKALPQGTNWEDQETWANERIGDCMRVALDSSAIGDQFAERICANHAGTAEGVKFTNQAKDTLATGLKLALQRGKLHPNADDVELRREVLSLRREYTASGMTRYESPRSDTRGHGDRAWSLALAVYAGGGAALSQNMPGILTRGLPTDVPRGNREDYLRPGPRGLWR